MKELEKVAKLVQDEQRDARKDIEAFENKIKELEQKKKRLEEGKRSLFERYADTNELAIEIERYRNGLEKAKEVLDEVNEEIAEKVRPKFSQALRDYHPESKVRTEIEKETEKYIAFIQSKYEKLLSESRANIQRKGELMNIISSVNDEGINSSRMYSGYDAQFVHSNVLLRQSDNIKSAMNRLINDIK